MESLELPDHVSCNVCAFAASPPTILTHGSTETHVYLPTGLLHLNSLADLKKHQETLLRFHGKAFACCLCGGVPKILRFNGRELEGKNEGSNRSFWFEGSPETIHETQCLYGAKAGASVANSKLKKSLRTSAGVSIPGGWDIPSVKSTDAAPRRSTSHAPSRQGSCERRSKNA